MLRPRDCLREKNKSNLELGSARCHRVARLLDTLRAASRGAMGWGVWTAKVIARLR